MQNEKKKSEENRIRTIVIVLNMTGGCSQDQISCTSLDTFDGEGRSLDEHRTVRYNWGNDESRSGLLDLLLFLLPFLGYKTHCEFV